MNYSQQQLENIGDAFRSAGYESEEIIDNDHYANVVDCALLGLNIRIKNNNDHAGALEVLNYLIDRNPKAECFESSLINLVSLAIEDYKKENF